MSVENELQEAKRELENIHELKKKHELEMAKKDLHDAMTTGEVLRKGKNFLATNMALMVEEDFPMFKDAMRSLAKRKPGVYSKLFLEIQKNIFPVKEEKTVNVNINYETLSDEDLAALARGKNIRDADIIDQ